MPTFFRTMVILGILALILAVVALLRQPTPSGSGIAPMPPPYPERGRKERIEPWRAGSDFISCAEESGRAITGTLTLYGELLCVIEGTNDSALLYCPPGLHGPSDYAGVG